MIFRFRFMGHTLDLNRPPHGAEQYPCRWVASERPDWLPLCRPVAHILEPDHCDMSRRMAGTAGHCLRCVFIKSTHRRGSMSAQIRPSDSSASGGPIVESGSFAAHLKTLERKIPLRGRYENFIGGKWVAPTKGAYFDNISPATG